MFLIIATKIIEQAFNIQSKGIALALVATFALFELFVEQIFIAFLLYEKFIDEERKLH